jgi:hypothetical protein
MASFANANNANSANNALKKSFCKVCCDAGKSESEYTNHCVKNNTGKVICPILLNQLCRYCSKKGHTVSYCPVMAKNKKRETYLLEKEKNVKSVKKDVKKSTLKNKFQVLDSDSEEEVEEEVEEEEEQDEVEIISEYKITYASVCAAVKACETYKACATVKACATDSSGIKPILVNGKRAWADYSSDEDEDEDE